MAHERVGMAVNQPPLRALPAIDQRHPQRPVLVRQAADLAMLTLDHCKDDQIVLGVGLDEFEFGVTISKIAGEPRQPRGTHVKTPAGCTAKRLHQGEVVRDAR